MTGRPTSPPTSCPVCGARTEAEQFWCGYPGCPDGRGPPGPARYGDDAGGCSGPLLLAALVVAAVAAVALGLLL